MALSATIGVARPDRGDQRLGVVRPPVGGGLFDGLQIGDLLGPVTHPLPNPVGRVGLGAHAVVVGVEELPVGGDHVPAERCLLVAQRGLQLIGRYARRLDARR